MHFPKTFNRKCCKSVGSDGLPDPLIVSRQHFFCRALSWLAQKVCNPDPPCHGLALVPVVQVAVLCSSLQYICTSVAGAPTSSTHVFYYHLPQRPSSTDVIGEYRCKERLYAGHGWSTDRQAVCISARSQCISALVLHIPYASR